MNFLHKEKKNNIICYSENKGEEVTAVIIGLLPYKALKRFFLSNEKKKRNGRNFSICSGILFLLHF